MTRALLISLLLLSMPMTMNGAKKDSLILGKIYEFQKTHLQAIDSLQDNVYAKFRFNVEKRNSILWLIPSMYVLAKDPREYIRESYNSITFKDGHNFIVNNQVVTGTIRRNRKAMPVINDFNTPHLYDIALYNGYMLSPFSRINRVYYRFNQYQQSDGTTRLEFRPKLYNTQLVTGYAIVETETGRIIKCVLSGEFDMMSFYSEVNQDDIGPLALMPTNCTTALTFRFMGNRVSTVFNTMYHQPYTLPDSIDENRSKEMIDSLRPIPLAESDKRIYEADAKRQQEAEQEAAADTIETRSDKWKHFWWDIVGDNLVTPLAAETKDKDTEFRLSPIINPLNIRYSGSKGFSYKMNLYLRYKFNEHRYLTLDPMFGYNFKQKQFYFTAPLRMTYNPKRNGYAQITVGNNRISNSTVLNEINHENKDTLKFPDESDQFIDNYLELKNNIMAYDWLDVEMRLIYHQRTPLNKELMMIYDKPTRYRSFAPALELKFKPWYDRGPVITVDYERSIKNVLKSNLQYERWEFDAQWKKKIVGLRFLNLRTGYGFYTDRSENYFMDYTNFYENNLPEGWEDHWSGNFQLLDSRVYNESNFYFRNNVSYESPLLFATWLPLVGKYIEKERLYFSNVIVQHARPYFELGYGLTNRYVSLGFFASFYNASFQKAGITFDFELFKRW
jgi:gamma-glutamylcyclotransferase (GGCT)/AIG2-like uncharacterized protein YtfP